MITEIMTEGTEIDYTSFFESDNNHGGNRSGNLGEGKSFSGPDETRKGQILDMVNKHHLGTTIFCLIPDRVLTRRTPDSPAEPRLYRKINYAYTGHVASPNPDDKYPLKIQLMEARDYLCQLSPSQKDIINHLREQAESFRNLVNFDNRGYWPEVANMITISRPGQILFAYGKYLKFIQKGAGEIVSPEIGQMRVMKFEKGMPGKSDFATVLNGTIANKITIKGGSSFLKEYFNRTPGMRRAALILNVNQTDTVPKQYTISCSMEECETPFEITTEDLEIADNLNTRVFNIESFDDEYFNKLSLAFDAVQAKVDSLAKNVTGGAANTSTATPVANNAPTTSTNAFPF